MIKSMQNHLFEIIIKKDPRLCLNSSVIVERITNNIINRVLNRNDFSTLFFVEAVFVKFVVKIQRPILT